jgi:hypothetical protein
MTSLHDRKLQRGERREREREREREEEREEGRRGKEGGKKFIYVVFQPLFQASIPM